MDIVARAKGILVEPKAEWPKIEREPGDISYLFSSYVAILAAIPPETKPGAETSNQEEN